MLLEPHTSQFADGRRLLRPYVAQAKGIAVASKGIVALSQEQETDWSALMLAVRDGRDRAAFALLFRHFAPRVKSYLMKSGASAAQAEECAQDVMTTLWQKAGMFDPARASVSTWIFTIARNRMIDMVRRDRRPDPEPAPWDRDAEPDQAEVYAAAEESRALTAALADLPEKQRSLIQRAFYGDLSHSEIALETGLPLGTIKSRIRLALDRLRARLSES
ncbi:sigma-70 family RNA polymerase sigma factor [bacterium]|nr:sigma-70 family RNA polymerase sigma factor [bacterium]